MFMFLLKVAVVCWIVSYAIGGIGYLLYRAIRRLALASLWAVNAVRALLEPAPAPALA